MPQALKIPDVKATVEKEWEKLEKIPAWQLTKVRNKKEVIEEATVSFQEFAAAASTSKVQRQARTPR